MGSWYGEQSDHKREMNFNTMDLEALVEEAHILLRGNVNRNKSLKAFKK